MKLVAYVRISREDENPENQIYAMKQYASLKGIDLVISDEYIDVGISGGVEPFKRTGFMKAVNVLERGEADGIMVYALDRIARSLWNLAEVYRKFDERGWILLSVREDWLNILDKNVKNLIIAVLGWAGEMERKFISERTKEALKRVKDAGKKLGRPKALDEEEEEKLVELVTSGLSLRKACKLMGISYSTGKRVMRKLYGSKTVLSNEESQFPSC